MDHQQQQQNDKTEQQLLIVTDSASCLDALQGTSRHRNKRQHPYVQAIMKHVDRRSTTLMWVPAHQGIVGNEEADQLAALGRTDGTPLYTTEVPGDDVCTWVERIVRRAWVQHWRDQDSGRDSNSNSSSSNNNNSNSSNSYRNDSNRSQSNSNNSNSNSSNSNSSNRNNKIRKTLFLRKLKTNPTETWPDRRYWREQRVLSRLRTGHTRFSHNYNIRRNDDDDEQEDGNNNINNDSNNNDNTNNDSNNNDSNNNDRNNNDSNNRFESWCTACNTRNGVEHAICECRRFGQQRKMYGIADNIRMALQSDASSEAALICYLRDTGLYGRT